MSDLKSNANFYKMKVKLSTLSSFLYLPYKLEQIKTSRNLIEVFKVGVYIAKLFLNYMYKQYFAIRQHNASASFFLHVILSIT